MRVPVRMVGAVLGTVGVGVGVDMGAKSQSAYLIRVLVQELYQPSLLVPIAEQIGFISSFSHSCLVEKTLKPAYINALQKFL